MACDVQTNWDVKDTRAMHIFHRNHTCAQGSIRFGMRIRWINWSISRCGDRSGDIQINRFRLLNRGKRTLLPLCEEQNTASVAMLWWKMLFASRSNAIKVSNTFSVLSKYAALSASAAETEDKWHMLCAVAFIEKLSNLRVTVRRDAFNVEKTHTHTNVDGKPVRERNSDLLFFFFLIIIWSKLCIHFARA